MKETNNIAVLIERLARVLQNDAHAHGLKPTQWEALRYLARANKFSRSPSSVTAYLGMTKGTVSQTLAALERKGLIEKSADPVDKRNIHIRVTIEGMEVLKEDPVLEFVDAMSSLGGKNIDAVESGLQILLSTVLKRRAGKPFGACRTCKYFQEERTGYSSHACSLLNVALSPSDAEHICIEHAA